jgi:hypothetical protein
LGGEVKKQIGLVGLKQSLNVRRSDVHFHHRGSSRNSAFQAFHPAFYEIVHDYNIVPLGHQTIGQMTAYESGSPGDE